MISTIKRRNCIQYKSIFTNEFRLKHLFIKQHIYTENHRK